MSGQSQTLRCRPSVGILDPIGGGTLGEVIPYDLGFRGGVWVS